MSNLFEKSQLGGLSLIVLLIKFQFLFEQMLLAPNMCERLENKSDSVKFLLYFLYGKAKALRFKNSINHKQQSIPYASSSIVLKFPLRIIFEHLKQRKQDLWYFLSPTVYPPAFT